MHQYQTITLIGLIVMILAMIGAEIYYYISFIKKEREEWGDPDYTSFIACTVYSILMIFLSLIQFLITLFLC